MSVRMVFAILITLLFAPARADMVKFMSIWEVPGDPALLDQWYRQTHSQESLHFVGPWLRRYWAYRALEVPQEAERLKFVRYRLTEMWYESTEARHEVQRAWYPLSPPPSGATRALQRTTITQIWVRALPSERFIDDFPRARPTYLRWNFFMRYPQAVSVADGEKWFTEVHAPELKKLNGLRRFVCYKSVDEINKPDQWLRACELWFDDYAAWRQAVLDSPPNFTAPSWSKQFPFVDSVNMFTAQYPDMDFLRDFKRVP